MSDPFKTFVGQQDMEPSPLLGHGDNNTQEESYQEMYSKFQRTFQVASFFNWICILIASAFITYIVNNWKMEMVDPDTCISDRDRRIALVISLLFGAAGADRFYLGYPISACFKSVLGGIFNVWWIIDLVRLWMGVFYDANGCILK
ncbi:hypothetical protein HPULCUR_004796 [Helicostylum pulchrum]|uniref:TM2 domain-containing protein n=1 Tax=Helicostylum pulchrum TaxID=562976 RepID=A0ABP9XXA0_9FUNG